MIANWKSCKKHCPPENEPLVVTTAKHSVVCPVMFLRHPCTGKKVFFEWSSDYSITRVLDCEVIAWDYEADSFDERYDD